MQTINRARLRGRIFFLFCYLQSRFAMWHVRIVHSRYILKCGIAKGIIHSICFFFSILWLSYIIVRVWDLLCSYCYYVNLNCTDNIIFFKEFCVWVQNYLIAYWRVNSNNFIDETQRVKILKLNQILMNKGDIHF